MGLDLDLPWKVGQLSIYIYIYNPKDHCFDWKRPCFGGLTLKNRGRWVSRYIIIQYYTVYTVYIYSTGWLNLQSNNVCVWVGENWRNHSQSLLQSSNHSEDMRKIAQNHTDMHAQKSEQFHPHPKKNCQWTKTMTCFRSTWTICLEINAVSHTLLRFSPRSNTRYQGLQVTARSYPSRKQSRRRNLRPERDGPRNRSKLWVTLFVRPQQIWITKCTLEN